MSAPLKRRSPHKDPEVGPTPNKAGPATPAVAKSPAQNRPQSFVARHKKLLAIAAVIGIVVIVVAAAAGSRNASSAKAATNASKSGSSAVGGGSVGTGGSAGTGGSSGTGGSGGWMPGTGTDPSDGNDDPSVPEVPTEDPTVTVGPIVPPTPEIPPVPTNTCAFPGGLGNVSWYNGFFSEYFWTNGSSMEGRLAVGGNAFINQFSIGTNYYGQSRKYDCPNQDLNKFRAADYAALIGGGLTLNGTAIFSGGLGYGYVIDDVNFTRANTQNGCPLTPGANILMFGQEFAKARAASDAIAQFGTPLSTVVSAAENLRFVLRGNVMTEFFRVTEEQLVNTSVFILQGTPKKYNGTTATIIIDIVLSEANTKKSLIFANWGAQGFNGVNARNIIWNFNDAQELSFQRGSWFGTILAPNAKIENSWGNFWGGVIARAWNTKQREINVQFHNSIFNGTVFTDNC